MKLVYEKHTGEESCTLVYEEHGKLYLYSVPQYGGCERFECEVRDIQEAEDIARTWT